MFSVQDLGPPGVICDFPQIRGTRLGVPEQGLWPICSPYAGKLPYREKQYKFTGSVCGVLRSKVRASGLIVPYSLLTLQTLNP